LENLLKEKNTERRHSTLPPKGKDVETAGEVFPGGIITEVVRDPATGQVALIKVNGQHATLAKQVTHDRVTYVPPRKLPRVFDGMVLPMGISTTPVRTDKVCGELNRLFGTLVDEAGAWMLSIIVLATWAIDWLSAAPALAVTGPRNEAVELLKLMGCVCRRGLLLGHLRHQDFRVLPMDLAPTLLVASLDRPVHRVISNSTVRGLPGSPGWTAR
jgi:hypothetical protein